METMGCGDWPCLQDTVPLIRQGTHLGIGQHDEAVLSLDRTFLQCPRTHLQRNATQRSLVFIKHLLHNLP